MSFLPKSILQSTLTLIFSLGLAGCSSEQPAEQGVPLSLTEWLDAEYEEQLMRSPMGLTYLGRSERKDELDEFTLESYQADLAWQAASVDEMESRFDRAELSESEQLSYDLWKYSYDQSASGEAYFYSRLVFDQMNGLHSFVPTFLINFHTVTSVSDFEALVVRLNLIKPRMMSALDFINPRFGASMGRYVGMGTRVIKTRSGFSLLCDGRCRRPISKNHFRPAF